MDNAPTPCFEKPNLIEDFKKTELIEKKEFEIKNKDIIYDTILSKTINKKQLVLQCYQRNNKYNSYETFLNFDDLIKLNKAFKICESIDDAYSIIFNKFQEKNVFIQDTKDFKVKIIYFSLTNIISGKEQKIEIELKNNNKDAYIMNEFEEKLNIITQNENNLMKENENIKKIINDFSQYKLNIDNKIKKFEEEINTLKKENENLKKDIELLKSYHENDNLRKNQNNITPLGNVENEKYEVQLKKILDDYKEAEDDEDKFEILKKYNKVLEELIKNLSKDFNNNINVEIYYRYVKDLFLSYIKALNMKEQLTKEDQEEIIFKIKENISKFIKQNSEYLDNLTEILKDIKKRFFLEIIINFIEQLNICGKECLKERKKSCKYNSLKYFEKARALFKKYIVNFKNAAVCGKKIIEKCKNEVDLSESYINDINSNAILLKGDNLQLEIESKIDTGFKQDAMGLIINKKDDIKKLKIVLSNYEKILINLSDRLTEEKAKCIANILKILKLLGNYNIIKMFQLAENCEFIVEKLNIDKSEKWYKEFEEIYNEIKEKYLSFKFTKEEKRKNIQKKYKDIFDEIDSKYHKRRNYLEFINYVLSIKPYPGFEEDKKNKVINFKKESKELIKFLQFKYSLENLAFPFEDEKSQLEYFLIEHIGSYLNSMSYNYYIF